MSQIYISLDLETTGFDPNSDQVIEIAAIKFSKDNKGDYQILEKFETLVNPETEIPPMVSHITGINHEQIKDAPTFDKVSGNLSKFLGNYPIVGHNIDFDLTFLESKGIPILNKQFDTLQLSSILIPNLPSYSLDTISRLLKLVHQNKHRAMSDAHVCFELFQILVNKIETIPAKTLKQIQALMPKCEWDLGELFSNTKTDAKKSEKNKIAKKDISEDSPILKPKNKEELLELLNANSPLSKILPDFESRPGQAKLLAKIIQACEENFNLIAEAGTGTGKTLAYLLAAAYESSKTTSDLDKKIIISTHTNNLQDQIIHKDFDLVHKIFPNLKISMLKGRKKYLSQDRFAQLKTKLHLEQHELTAFIKILIWLDHTETGDLDELNLQNKELVLIDEICSTLENVNKTPTTDTADFLERARIKAENSDIIVVNHALLIQDAISVNKILPEHQILIVDEAHHLEKTVTDALTLTLSFSRLLKPLNHQEELISSIAQDKLPFDQDFLVINSEIAAIRIKFEHQVEKLFNLIRHMLDKYGKNQPGLPTQLSLNISLKNSDEWQNISQQLSSFKAIADEYQILSSTIQKALNKTELPEAPEIIVQSQNLTELFNQVQKIPTSLEEKIIWLSKGFDENTQLHCAPLSVKTDIHQKIFSYKQSVILTSATLTTFGNFNYIRSELGLGEDFEEIKLASHFSYPDQVKIIIPEDLPEPKEPQYIEDCKHVINDVILQNGGRTLILFTAKKELAKVFHDLAPSLKKAGLSLLAQGLTGGRGKIISHFQDEPEKCAILGTNSFWEGVDLAGDLLTCVIIQKLPFDPPDDPIIYARSQKFKKPFDEYSLPRAILRFKQGFGRLIRSAKDTGSVVILDSRLVQKSYGRQFIASLPEGIKISQCSKQQAAKML